MSSKTRKIYLTLFLMSLIFLLSAANTGAQQKLTKAELVAKANALFESKAARAALDLIDDYPEFSDDVEILYIKSVAYIDLRDFKNADLAFQKQFDAFVKDAAESRAAAEKILRENAPTRENKSLAILMYSTALTSYGTADLANSLRAVALEKAGIAKNERAPENLAGFEEFRENYEATALKTAGLCLQNNQLKDALSNYMKAIELNPKNPAAYEGRAKVYRRLKKTKPALADEIQAKRLRRQP